MSAEAFAPSAIGSFDAPAAIACGRPKFELRFRGLFHPGRGYAFPCDVQGRVDLDALSETARTHYFYARAMVGAEFHFPEKVMAGAELHRARTGVMEATSS
jgi:hypothetical protein